MPADAQAWLLAVLALIAAIVLGARRIQAHWDARLAEIEAHGKAMPAWQRKRRLQRRRTYVKLRIAGFTLNRFGP